ncbi:MAG: S-adenosyl-l-methionine hydroxide adenosyltransferase family protein [Deltaproteobacteria bacterium]
MSIVTLTTDFGICDSYVAQMKGVILGIAPDVQLVDVTHAIPPQDVGRAAAVIAEIARVFPAGTVHVAVVDPGVGSDRALLAAEAAGQRFLAPDNGLLTLLFRRFPPARIHRLADDRFWRKPVSATFHGRDILAPVAAHWTRGADLADFGPAVDVATLVTLFLEEPRRIGQTLIGRVESVDAFGNLITNVREADLPAGERGCFLVYLGDSRIAGVSRCYADVSSGQLLALIGSSGSLEIAVNGGSAARQIGVSVGTEVRVEPKRS